MSNPAKYCSTTEVECIVGMTRYKIENFSVNPCPPPQTRTHSREAVLLAVGEFCGARVNYLTFIYTSSIIVYFTMMSTSVTY